MSFVLLSKKKAFQQGASFIDDSRFLGKLLSQQNIRPFHFHIKPGLDISSLDPSVANKQTTL